MNRIFFSLLLLLLFFSKVQSQSVGGLTTGSTAYCDSLNSGFISLSFNTGSVLYWETSIDNGVTWLTAINTATTMSYNNVAQTTWYRAVVQSGTFTPAASSTSTITIYPKARGGNINGAGDFCEQAPAGSLQLVNQVGQVKFWEYSVNGGVSWTTITNTLSSQSHSTVTQNTQYRAIVENITTCPTDTSAVASFVIFQSTNPGSILGTDTVCYGVNSGTINLTGHLGDIVDWISTTNSGSTFSSLSNTTAVQSFSNTTQTTWYSVIVKNGVCPSDTSNYSKIVVVNANTVTAGPDKLITRYEETTLQASGSGTVQWTPSAGLNDASALNPSASPLTTTNYTITLTNRFSCVSKDEVLITVNVLIPSAITPNADGVNDYFEVEKIETFTNSSLVIFNRWGNVVYKEAPYKNKWNGKTSSGQDLPDDVYYYTLDYGVGEKPLSGYVLIKR